jgi:AcrR family transcriptional regulator
VEHTGLRERSKARRRAAIIRAGLELFAERGYDATTVADIAAAADVAPRTVAMYFPSKQDIAMARFSESVDELTGALRARRPGESGTSVIERWLRSEEPGAERELKELSQRMFRVNPELNALRMARMAEAVAEGAELVARELGLPQDAPGPRIAAAATGAILVDLVDIPPGPRRDEAITMAMRFLDAGIASLGRLAAGGRRLWRLRALALAGPGARGPWRSRALALAGPGARGPWRSRALALAGVAWSCLV